MKKIISLFLAVLMLVSVMTIVASAVCAHENTTYHQRHDWVCDVPGYTAGTYCNDCEEWISGHDKFTRPNDGGHDYKFDHTIASTCTSMGMDVYKCSLCGDTYSDWHNKYPYAPHEFEYTYYSGREDWCHAQKECKNCGLEQDIRNDKNDGRHIDENGDRVCDFCKRDFSKCNHLCHKGGFFYKIALFFWKLFKSNKNCKCGYPHY